MLDFETLTDAIGCRTVLCVGDLMVDVLPGFSTTSPVDRARAGKA